MLRWQFHHCDTLHPNKGSKEIKAIRIQYFQTCAIPNLCNAAYMDPLK
jgi:hypothetical protein